MIPSIRETFSKIILQERDRLLLFAPVVLGIGIVFGVFFPFLSWGFLGIFLLLSIVTSLIVYKRSRMLCFIVALFSLGVYISQTGGILETNLLTQKKFISKEYDKIKFTAQVSFLDETHPTMKNMRRVTFKNIEFLNKDLSFIKTAKMTCSARMSENISPDDFVKVIGKITPFKMPAIPGAFDQAQYNASVKLDTIGIVYSIKKLNDLSDNNNYFSKLRRILTKTILQKMNAPSGGIASALLTGDKSSISTNVKEAFINSGTAHILAISGLHMSIIASIFYLFLVKFFQYFSVIFVKINPKKYAALMTIPITFLYLALSGFSPSATRAFIMTSVFLVSVIFGRIAISLRSVALAAFLILLFDSGSIFLVSFQLSFCAVVALISFYELYQYKFYEVKNNHSGIFWSVYFYITGSLISTLVASFATLPISIAVFNRLSLSGLLGNLIAIPTVTFLVIPFGLLSLISDFFMQFLDIVLIKLITILEIISNIPGSNVTVKSPSLFTLYMIVFGGIILCLFRTKVRLFGICIMFVGFILWILEQKPDIIFPPEIEECCFVEDGVFYTSSLQKGRRAFQSIQRNLGFEGKLQKKEPKWKKKAYKKGKFIWSKSGITKEIASRKHPYCPAYFK